MIVADVINHNLRSDDNFDAFDFDKRFDKHVQILDTDFNNFLTIY